MKNYWQYNKTALKLFIKNMNKFVGYRLVSTFMVTMLLIPFLGFASRHLMRWCGYDYVTNGLIGKFLMSPQGIVLMLLALVAGFLMVLLELGGLVVLCHQGILNAKESRFIDIFRYSLKRFRLLIGTDGILIVIYFVILGPLLNSDLTVTVLDNLKIPGFIMQSINANDMLTLLFGGVTGILIFLTCRWMFALHVLMLDDTMDRRFLKNSAKLLKGHMKKIVKFLTASFFFGILMLVIGFLIFAALGSLMIIILPGPMDFKIFLVTSLGAVLMFIFLMVDIPISMLAMTQLYHELTGVRKPLDIKVIEGRTFVNRLLANRYFIMIGVMILLVGGSVFAYVTYEFYDHIIFDVDITAHRGSSFQAPENTMAAVKQAYENGADYVEIDVQLTKDGHVILLHDETFMRTTGHNLRPDQMTLEAIQALDAGVWFSKEFQGERIPTLKEVMAFAKGRIKINIEIKGRKYSPDIGSVVVDLIHEMDFLNDCVVTSLVYEDIELVEILDSRIETGYILYAAFGNLDHLHTDFYSIEASNVDERFVNAAHAIGRKVHVWTVNDPEEMKALMSLGVDNIITDQELVLRKLLDESDKE